MRIAIYGTGGVGGYFGGRLAKAGNEVWFIARGEHLAAMKAGGLHVESVRGDFVVDPVNATDNPAEIGAVDLVLLALKTWQIPPLAPEIKRLLGPGTVVMTLQNGVDAPRRLGELIGPERVLPGLVRIISQVDGPGRIRDSGGPAQIIFGESDNRPSKRVERAQQTLADAGIDAVVPEDIHVALWEKFLFVVAMGGVGAITRAPIGIIRSLRETRSLLEEDMREIRDVGYGCGVRMPAEVVASSMALVDGLPEGATTSMHRDLISGRRSELEEWCGSVVRLGEESGVATPINSFLYRSLLPLELRALGEIAFEG